jgi:ribosomal protein S18 acetylase RimI-like enzyme
VIIRSATAQDLHAIALLHVSTWQKAYRGVVPQPYLDQLSVDARQAAWADIFEKGGSELSVAEDSGEILGFISYGKSRDNDASGNTGEIYAIYVAPQHWSTGIGWGLLQYSWQDLNNRAFTCAAVWVLVENARAIRFYERAGFRQCRGSETSIDIGGKRLLEVRYEIAIIYQRDRADRR